MEDAARPPLRPPTPGPTGVGSRCMLRLDPWAAEYEGSIQVADDEEGADVDVAVESSSWAAIAPPPAARPRQVAFVDGVRRVEHRLLVSDGERTVFGLLGSYGVGAAVVEAIGTAHSVATRTNRSAGWR